MFSFFSVSVFFVLFCLFWFCDLCLLFLFFSVVVVCFVFLCPSCLCFFVIVVVFAVVLCFRCFFFLFCFFVVYVVFCVHVLLCVHGFVPALKTIVGQCIQAYFFLALCFLFVGFSLVRRTVGQAKLPLRLPERPRLLEARRWHWSTLPSLELLGGTP